eukprot:TRINITY_DN19871_c0_g1_i1.p1 TRINITY_DN19871_c0_g1~~TRINITY_DN19871_c0_g1_i1.p1  ORF type:complete len:223 (+),score=32.98 TRINITY_DN19871_c0_g1_i1:166-834(+)
MMAFPDIPEGCFADPSSTGSPDVFIPYIQNTFLAFPPARLAESRGSRSRSLEVRSTCDRYAGEVHALMYKVQPVASGAATGSAKESSETEEDEKARGPSIEELLADPEALAQIPVDEDGQVTSLGSALHHLGECRPCAFLGNARRPCTNGVACMFCHFSHDTRRRSRLCRKRRQEMRASVMAALEAAGEEGLADPPRYLPIAWPVDSAVRAVPNSPLLEDIR